MSPQHDGGGYDSEDNVDIVTKRGNADFVVKPDDRVLRCIERENEEESPLFFKRTSDALKKLFKEKSWEAVKAMDGFDDGEVSSWHGGDIVYSRTTRL